ncbi:MAG: MBL fold metallo-hydrolase [Calditrichaeota bacterium]|nr:MAG: MBL fold metallo-hydrolase [Calditrichota bacterium]
MTRTDNPMKIYALTLGMFMVNNYLVVNPDTRRAILIDACEDYQSILRQLDQLKAELVYLINTHGHGDHIAGNGAIIERTGAKLMIHRLDEPFLRDPNLNMSALLGVSLQSPPPDRFLEEGDVVEMDGIRLQVLHTPGHTPGHISLLADGVAFVGDVIFRESIGRTDFPYASHEQLVETIRTKIYTLPEDTVLLNGHGPETTVRHEKAFNPFVRG